MKKITTTIIRIISIVLLILFVHTTGMTMPPEEPANYDSIFLIIGDARGSLREDEYGIVKAIIDDAITYTETTYGEPDAVVFVGDFVESGDEEDQWEGWREAAASVLDYELVTTIGNHDDERNSCYLLCNTPIGDLVSNYVGYFSWNYREQFGVDQWYAKDINNVRFISFDSNLDEYNLFGQDGDILEPFQKQWVQRELDNNTSEWTIALYHHSAYSSYSYFKNGHGSNYYVREAYVPFFESGGVDLSISGHNHWWERTVPIFNEKEDANGIVYITTGGGGGTLLPTSLLPSDKVCDDRGNILSEENWMGFHFSVITIDDATNVLSLTAIQYNSHDIIDYVEVEAR